MITPPALARILEILAEHVGGFEEQQAEQIARQIAWEFGNDPVRLGLAPGDQARAERNARILEAVERGMRPAEAARMFSVSRQWVHTLVRQPKKPRKRQLSI